MADEFRSIGFNVEEKCGKCGRRYMADGKPENMINRGWTRKWSWRKFSFIWVCQICNTKIRI